MLMSGNLRADAPVSERARGLFRDGVAHLKASDGPEYAEAYEDFKAAYADSPSSKILGNLGLCATKLERDGEAIEAYQRYLDEAGAKSPRERQAIAADLEALKRRVAYITLRVSPEEATVLDRRFSASGEPVVNTYVLEGGEQRLGLRSGRHRLTIEAPNHAPETLEIELSPGSDAEREVTLTSNEEGESAPVTEPSREPELMVEPAKEGGIGVGVWVGVGVTGALAIATGVAGGMAASNHGAFEDAVAAGDDAEAADRRDRGKTLNIAGDVLLGATIATAVVTGVFLTLDLLDDGAEGGDDVVALRPSVGLGHLGLEGRF